LRHGWWGMDAPANIRRSFSVVSIRARSQYAPTQNFTTSGM